MNYPQHLLEPPRGFNLHSISIQSALPAWIMLSSRACDARLRGEKFGAEAERFARFNAAMQQVSTFLGRIYKQLTGGSGDAYFSHSQDALLLLAEGVAFHVRQAFLSCHRPACD